MEAGFPYLRTLALLIKLKVRGVDAVESENQDYAWWLNHWFITACLQKTWHFLIILGGQAVAEE